MLELRQYGHHITDSNNVFFNENIPILNPISLKFVPSGPIVPFHNNISPSGEQPEHRILAHKL